MFKTLSASALTLACTLFSHNAIAATYLVSVGGNISDGYSVDKNFNAVANPTSSLNTGDAFLLTYTFNTANSSVQPLYDADPTINIYWGQASDLKLTVGSFTLSSPQGTNSFLSTQLWNNYNVAGGGPTDAFDQSVVQQLTGASPIDLGIGPINFTATLNAFDFTATARNSDLITEVPPLTAYSNKSGSLGFINATTYLQTSFTINELTATVSEISAVPEPATWTMLILGAGTIGFATRRRRQLAKLG
jgi:hypothetical protein